MEMVASQPVLMGLLLSGMETDPLLHVLMVVSLGLVQMAALLLGRGEGGGEEEGGGGEGAPRLRRFVVMDPLLCLMVTRLLLPVQMAAGVSVLNRSVQLGQAH